LNYPNNPTGAVAELEFFERAVAFARKHDLAVLHDGPYSEMAFDDYRPLSFLQAAGAREVGIEFHSFSKTYNMTGWRIGMAVGNAAMIDALMRVKSNLDSGIPQPSSAWPSPPWRARRSASPSTSPFTSGAATAWRWRWPRSACECDRHGPASTSGPVCRRARRRWRSATACWTRRAWW